MYQESFKIRISNFASIILENDAKAYGFLRNNENSNINGLLNKLIPILLDKRKERRKYIHDTINEALEFRFDEKKTDRLRSYIDTVMDKIYFAGDEYDSDKSEELWIRPTKDNADIFEEIKDSETEICQLNKSDYFRGLLNEYVRLPQFRREQILFDYELNLLIESIYDDYICRFRYDGNKYKALILLHWFEPFDKHNNYIFFYDIEHDLIKVALLHEIQEIYIQDKKFFTDNIIDSKLDEIFDTRAFIEKDTFEIER